VIQQYGLTFIAIIEGDVERATECDEQLTEALMGMSSPTLASRHVIYPIGPFNVKRYLATSLGHRQVASRINDFGQVDEFNL
jgi:hypothetical protein